MVVVVVLLLLLAVGGSVGRIQSVNLLSLVILLLGEYK